MFQNKRVAILFLSGYANLPKSLANWAISDLDAFFDNLNVWTDSEADFLATFFSNPIPGLRQHLGNHQKSNVGVAGESLLEKLEVIKSFYLGLGYDVVEMNGNKVMNYTQSRNKKDVRITLF